MGFPKSTRVAMKYVSIFSVDVDVGGVTKSKSFRLNGCYDPDVSVGGHQPYYFDQLMAVYSLFQVVNCAVKVTMSCFTASRTPYVVIGNRNATDAIELDPQTGSEQDGAWSTVLGLDNGGGANKFFSRNFNIAKLFGVDPKNYLDEPNFQGSVAGDPPSKWYIDIRVAEPYDASTNAVVHFKVELIYDTIFSDLKLNAGS